MLDPTVAEELIRGGGRVSTGSSRTEAPAGEVTSGTPLWQEVAEVTIKEEELPEFVPPNCKIERRDPLGDDDDEDHARPPPPPINPGRSMPVIF